MRRLTLLFLSFMLLLSGCMPYVRQPPEAETTRITVGFSQVGAESDWRVANTESMRESLSEENGFELLFDNARQKQENQFKAIRTFIQQDVDYIVLAPVTETGWESVLEEARTAGIPVIIVDRQIETDDDSLYTSWVGSDFRRTADEAVSWLAERAIGIYFLHQTFIWCFGANITLFGVTVSRTGAWWSAVCYTLIVWALTVVSVVICSYLPGLRKLVT